MKKNVMFGFLMIFSNYSVASQTDFELDFQKKVFKAIDEQDEKLFLSCVSLCSCLSEIKNEKDQTVLQVIILKDFLEGFQILMESDQSINSVDWSKDSCVWQAYRIIDFLINNKFIDITSNAMPESSVSQKKIFTAIKTKNEKTLRSCFLFWPHLSKLKNDQDRTVLQLIILKDFLEGFQILMESDQSINSVELLHYAVSNKAYQIVNFLINNNLIKIDALNSANQTVLYSAAFKGDIEMVQLLLQLDADKTTQSNYKSLLFDAVKINQERSNLMDNSWNQTLKPSEQRLKPFEQRLNSIDKLKCALMLNLNVNEINKEGYSPLYYMEEFSREIAWFLLKNDARIQRTIDQDGSLLAVSINRTNENIFRMIENMKQIKPEEIICFFNNEMTEEINVSAECQERESENSLEEKTVIIRPNVLKVKMLKQLYINYCDGYKEGLLDVLGRKLAFDFTEYFTEEFVAHLEQEKKQFASFKLNKLI